MPVVVHNRSHGAERTLLEAGASVASSPAAVAAACPGHRHDAARRPRRRGGARRAAGACGRRCSPASVIVDSSTIAPAAAIRFAAETAARGGTYLDAPVSGGEIGAIDGTLTFMVGGDAEALARVRPVLVCMGREDRIVHVGPSGAGQICKACNQLVIGGTMLAVAEALALARKAGVDGAKVRQALLGGFAASRVLEVHGERMLDRQLRARASRRASTRRTCGWCRRRMAAHGVPGAGDRPRAAAGPRPGGRRRRRGRLFRRRQGRLRPRRPRLTGAPSPGEPAPCPLPTFPPPSAILERLGLARGESRRLDRPRRLGPAPRAPTLHTLGRPERPASRSPRCSWPPTPTTTAPSRRPRAGVRHLARRCRRPSAASWCATSARRCATPRSRWAIWSRWRWARSAPRVTAKCRR